MSHALMRLSTEMYRIRTCMCLSGCVGGGVTQAPFTRLCSSGIALKLVPFFNTARELHIEHKNSPRGSTENLTEFT